MTTSATRIHPRSFLDFELNCWIHTSLPVHSPTGNCSLFYRRLPSKSRLKLYKRPFPFRSYFLVIPLPRFSLFWMPILVLSRPGRPPHLSSLLLAAPPSSRSFPKKLAHPVRTH